MSETIVIDSRVDALITQVDQAVVSYQDNFTVVTQIDEPTVLIATGAGPQGPKGDPGPAAFVSLDINNRTTVGTDGGLFTPDILVDPLAHYILAKS